MEYAVTNARIDLGLPLLLTLHLLVGLALVFSSVRGDRFTPRRVLGLIIGLFFAGNAAYFLTSLTVATSACRKALDSADVVAVRGTVEVLREFSKPGYGYVEFRVGERGFHTYKQGGLDCGFLATVGSQLKIKNGQRVELRAIGEVVLYMKIENDV